MFISPTGRDVMRKLRRGPLDHHQIAADLTLPPWRVLETLRTLRGLRLVSENWTRRRRCWELTDTGYAIVNAADQLTLDWNAGATKEAR